MQKYVRKMGKHIETVPLATIQKLQRWSWPGNVRELQNLVERSVILTNGDTLAISLPEKANNGAIDAARIVGNFEEQERIVGILRETNGRVSGPGGAASPLSLKRTTFLRRIKKLGINPPQRKNNFPYTHAGP